MEYATRVDRLFLLRLRKIHYDASLYVLANQHLSRDMLISEDAYIYVYRVSIPSASFIRVGIYVHMWRGYDPAR